MLVVIPYLPAVTDYDNLAAEFKRRGNLLHHSLLVVSSAEHEEAAYIFGSKLSDLFGDTKSMALPDVPRKQTQLANEFFHTAVKASLTLPSTRGAMEPATMYFDPQYRPTKTGWLDTIQSEYFLKGAPQVFGAFTKAEDGSRNFVGPLMFSKDYGPASGLLDFLPENVHWRTHLRWEFTNNSVGTKLIGPGAEAILKLKK